MSYVLKINKSPVDKLEITDDLTLYIHSLSDGANDYTQVHKIDPITSSKNRTHDPRTFQHDVRSWHLGIFKINGSVDSHLEIAAEMDHLSGLESESKCSSARYQLRNLRAAGKVHQIQYAIDALHKSGFISDSQLSEITQHIEKRVLAIRKDIQEQMMSNMEIISDVKAIFASFHGLGLKNSLEDINKTLNKYGKEIDDFYILLFFCKIGANHGNLREAINHPFRGMLNAIYMIENESALKKVKHRASARILIQFIDIIRRFLLKYKIPVEDILDGHIHDYGAWLKTFDADFFNVDFKTGNQSGTTTKSDVSCSDGADSLSGKDSSDDTNSSDNTDSSDDTDSTDNADGRKLDWHQALPTAAESEEHNSPAVIQKMVKSGKYTPLTDMITTGVSFFQEQKHLWSTRGELNCSTSPEVDITDSDMANSQFGRGSHTAQRFLR